MDEIQLRKPTETADDRRRAWWREQTRWGWRARPRQNRKTYDAFAEKPDALSKEERKTADKVYTTPATVRACYDAMRPFLPRNAVLFDPAAGGGVWLDNCPDKRDIFGIEAFPDRHGRPDLITRDFLLLEGDIRRLMPETMRARPLFAVGNPPFGYRQRGSVDFINRCFGHPSVQGVGFVLGRSIRAYRQQDQVEKDARLVLDVDLPDDAVHDRGRDPQVRTCFQVWVRGRTRHRGWRDLRQVERPPFRHPDFDLRPYSIKSVGGQPQGWSFAVSRTGEDVIVAEPGRHLDRALRWITVTVSDPAVEARLRKIDYDALARRHTVGTPGFGMSDIVAAYTGAA